MPSALSASRDFLTKAVSRVRSGVSESNRQLSEEGPAIKVEPFDNTNVSTPAGLIKLGTSIAAAQRDRANWQANQADAALARDRVAAETARLRAEASYYAGTGRQTGNPTGETTTYQKEVLARTDRRLGQEDTRIKDARARVGATAGQSQRLAKAKAGIAQLDAEINRQAILSAQMAMSKAEPGFQAALGGTAGAGDLANLGLPANFYDKEVGPSEYQRAALVNARKQALYDTYLKKWKTDYAYKYAAQRIPYEQVINEGIVQPDVAPSDAPQATQGGSNDDALIQAIMSLSNE